MPQPLTSKSITKIVLGDSTAARPKHAAAALEIIAEAARSEFEVGKALVSLSPKNGRRLATHYNSQENEARKGATVEAIAAVLLSEEDEALFDRLLKKHRSLQKERTPFAHWLYAYAPDREDLLVLINPKDELLAEAEFMFLHHNWIGHGPDEEPAQEQVEQILKAREPMIDRLQDARSAAMKRAWCYDLSELHRIAIRLKAVRLYIDIFCRLIVWKGSERVRQEMRQSVERGLHELDSPLFKIVGGVETRQL